MEPIKLPASFAKHGLVTPNGRLGWRRLLVGSEAREKTGKTHFSLTAPGPIAYLNFDRGDEGVIDKFIYDKPIGVMDIKMPLIANQTDLDAKRQAHLPIWQKFEKNYTDMVADAAIRSIVVDTSTDMWELLKLATFGTVSPKMDPRTQFPALNAKYKTLIRMAYDREINLVLIHRVKDDYQEKLVDGKPWSAKTGTQSRAGFTEDGYLVQVNIEHLRDDKTNPPKFGLRVRDCRQNPDINGLELWGEDCTFSMLGIAVFSDTNLEDWQ